MNEWFQITTNKKCVKRITKYLEFFKHTNYHMYDNDIYNQDSSVTIEVVAYPRLKEYKAYLKKYAMEVKLVTFDKQYNIIKEEII